MRSDTCHICGSTDLRADRALAGKLICSNCGQPYDQNQLFRKKSTYPYKKYIGLGVLAITIIILFSKI